MLGFYNYTVILTYIGMLSGFAGIVYAFNNNLHTSLLFLMIAGVCDMFDGAIASTMKRTVKEKRFGVQIDSLSDLVCFGVLPAVIAFTSSGSSMTGCVISGLYLLAALIRLAWFNVDEEERQQSEEGSRRVYYGLPVTAAALILPAMIAAGNAAGLPCGHTAIPTLALMGTALLMPFRIKKPQLKGKAFMLCCGIAEFALLITGTLL